MWTAGLESFVQQQTPLAQRTWLRVGGTAEFFAEPNDQDQLAELVRRAKENGIPVRVLGGGSNVLVPDEGVAGVVVHLSATVFAEVRTEGNTIIAGGGAKLGHVVTSAAGAGLAGLEDLVGIPGTIGGALHGNAGGKTVDIGRWTHTARVMTSGGEILARAAGDLVFSHRQSSLDELVILSAVFQLEEEDPDELTRRMQKLWIVKKAEQPLTHEPCGSIFKGPRGINAADLIDQAGLKGARVGGAEVSERNPNFIVTAKDATARDVVRLIELIRDRVAGRLGVDLELEIEVW